MTRLKTGESRAVDRPKRIPVSGHRNITTVNDREPGYVYRWVNDVDDRIGRYKLGGWEHVEGASVGDKTVETTGKIEGVVSKKVGASRVAYLMRIKEEWYNEDQAAKAKAIKENEDALLKREKVAEGRYGNLNISIKD